TLRRTHARAARDSTSRRSAPSSRVVVERSSRLLQRSEEARQDLGCCLPFLSFLGEPFAACARQFVILGLAIVVRYAPPRSDVAFLLELQQSRIDRSVIDCQLILAGLFDAARDAVAVQWPQRFERLENHQRERPLPDICLLTHRCNLPLFNLPMGKL